MTLLNKKWVINNSDPENTTIEKILNNRGLTEVNEDLPFHDPYLFSDMEKAVSRIGEAVEKKERVIIFGDYDVDGITATSILVHTLQHLGATVSYRIPNREKDGYGLNPKFIDEFIEKDIGLIVTVDCGISCRNEIIKAKEHNIDMIITDHHRIPENYPEEAYAIIHPKAKGGSYPCKELTGAGVALKLAQALLDKFAPIEGREEFLSSLFDLASLGTVADLGPIKGENKYIVRKGLEVLKTTRWAGLHRIKELAGLNNKALVSTSIGFQIAPRINAAGRIGNPYLPLSLLLQKEKTKETEIWGNELEKLNFKRRELTQLACFEAKDRIEKLITLPFILIEDSPQWHVGILGLIASRLVESYSRPSIMLQDKGDVLTASARSPEFFNIVEALNELSEYLISFGGHAQAAGFSIKKKNYRVFREKMTALAKKKLRKMDLKSTLNIDCQIKPAELTLNFFNELAKLEPFGIGNEKPTFILKSVKPHSIKKVGKDHSHLKLEVELSGISFDVIAFRMGEHSQALKSANSIDLVMHLDKNVWNNNIKLSLQALDFKINA
jgi:single-stranded-DNA-specific exonuclease